ncbi:hypothetical protein NP493_159g02083 [Ridgeia piscesae]|uniref:Rubicon Homology domain-containing protein n=1 Tax=Ridgeia piscesae TaxID=27915 RepID=A0AAD9P3S8_RIDPI|nr:hypothetical protein NP493_159g02083 [Ridgeia piscesae]
MEETVTCLFVCSAACGFCTHAKCLGLITRKCAAIKVCDNPTYLMSVCCERGLSSQSYRCAECRTKIGFQRGLPEARQCDYNGDYYCDMCHWNDTAVIPARVLHNWDFEPRKVCRASKQFLRLLFPRPVLHIQQINPMLFSYVEELNDTKRLREEIIIMKRYFLSCKAALDSKLLLQLQPRQHFVETSDMYSMKDLVDVATDVLLPELAKIHASIAQHIKTDCQVCQLKGYICELCDLREVLFPFDSIALVCPQCSTVLHRHCYMQSGRHCPNCERLSRSTS